MLRILEVWKLHARA